MFYITIKKGNYKKVFMTTESNLKFKIEEAHFYGYEVTEIFQDFN